jgi:hypothetical protein
MAFDLARTLSSSSFEASDTERKLFNLRLPTSSGLKERA